MNRAAFSALLAGAAVVSPLCALADPDLPTFRIGVVPSENFALALLANEHGFFRAIKANVEISIFPTSGPIAAGVLAGALDIGCSNWGAIANAHGRGLPLSVIAPGGMYTSASPTTMLTVAKNSTLKSAKEFNGKTIAVSTLRDAQQACVMKWSDVSGGDSQTIKFIEVTPTQMGLAVASGHVDAAAILEPSLSEALRTTVRAIAKPLDAVCTPQMASAYYGSAPFLDKNAAAVKSFIAAMKLAAQWANANHHATATILAKHSQLTVDEIEQTHRTSYTDALDPSTIQPIVDAMVDYKVLATRFPVAQTFWSQL